MAMRTPSSLRLENDSQPAGESWWTWSVWVEGAPEDLDRLEAVTYRLHPTFPRPVIKVTDASTRFRLSSAGWGEFEVAADAHTKDGETIRLSRWLRLDAGQEHVTPRRAPAVYISYSVADSETAGRLGEALSKEGIDVRTAGRNVALDLDVETQIDRQLREADAVIAVVSEPASRWVEQEALMAVKMGRQVIPVAVGEARIPGALSRIQRLALPNTGGVNRLARTIATQVKQHAGPRSRR